jgi:hypothetical protein
MTYPLNMFLISFIFPSSSFFQAKTPLKFFTELFDLIYAIYMLMENV